ncbi:MAG: protein kinase [Myxococcota bacterium]
MSQTSPPTFDGRVLEMGGITLKPGDCIGPYRYVEPIGKGGMAHVLLARAPGGEPVALKVLKASRFQTGLGRFRREFRALARVHHPNVIAVESYGDIHGHPYIAMEYVEGTDLHQKIRSFRDLHPDERWPRVEAILVDLASALAYIHSRGLVHRDLKPSNVLIDHDGRCHLTDFGIVKLLDANNDAYVSNTLVGTWAYASPEQISGRPIDHRSDLYSLGVILYAMLTGRRPFSAKNMSGYLDLHQKQPPMPPSRLYAPVPVYLERICLKLLEKAPRDRYQSASEILRELQHDDVYVPTQEAPAGWQPPMVGREAHFQQIHQSIAALTRSEGGALLIHGGEGSGRSRLLLEALRYAQGLGLSIDQLPLGEAEGTMDAALRLADTLSRELGGATPVKLLQAIEGFSATGRDGNIDLRYQLFDGIKATLRSLLLRGPRLLLIDDLHFASSSLMGLLGDISRSLISQGEAILIVATARDDLDCAALRWLSSADDLGFVADGLAARPLERDDVEKMLYDLLGRRGGTEALAQRLWRETEGNPLFMAEFMRSLIQRGAIVPESEGRLRLARDANALATEALEIPPGVRQVVLNRLMPLGAPDRQIISLIAASGRPLDIDALLDACDIDEEEVLDRVERLTAEGILEIRRVGWDPLYDFAYRKFGEVVMQEMSRDEQRPLHRRLAEALEGLHGDRVTAAETIGEQFRQAGDVGLAWGYLLSAARYLWDRALLADAAAVVDRLDAIESRAKAVVPAAAFVPQQRELLRIRGDIQLNRGDWSAAASSMRALSLAARRAGDWPVVSSSELKLGRALRRLGDPRRGAVRVQAVLSRALARGDRTAQLDALHQLAAMAWDEGDMDRCAQLSVQGLVAASGPEMLGSRAQCLMALTAVQANRGQIEDAANGLVEAEGILSRLGRKQQRTMVLNNLAELYVWRGELTLALEQSIAALSLSRELLYREAEETALQSRARAHIELCEWASAEADLQESLSMAMEMSLSTDVVSGRYLSGLVAVRRGQLDTARHHLQAGLVASRHQDPEFYAPAIQALMAACWSGIGRPAVARKILSNLEDVVDGLPTLRRCQVFESMAMAYVELRDQAAALRCARSADALASASGLRLVALRARTLLLSLVPSSEVELIGQRRDRLLETVLRHAPMSAQETLRAHHTVQVVG